MKELFMIGVGAAFINNVVLSQFLGICAFLSLIHISEPTRH